MLTTTITHKSNLKFILKSINNCINGTGKHDENDKPNWRTEEGFVYEEEDLF